MISRNRMKTFSLTVSALALMTAPAFAQTETTHPSLNMTLPQAMATGIQTNPEYGEVAASRRATDEELKQGRAGFLPSVDMRAESGWEYTDSPSTRGAGSDSENKWRNLVSLTLTQMLFDGFETKYEVERQKARVTSAAHRVRETAELVGLNIVESYLEVLRQRQLLVIAVENVQDHVSILEQIGEGVSGGRSTQADAEQAKARLAAARTQEAATREALNVAQSNYIRVVGDEPGQLMLPEVPFSKLEANVDAEVQKSLVYSPTLQIFAADIETAYAESIQTRSTFYPQVDLQVNGTQGHDLGGIDGRDTGASALVVANWNLYRGGADTARAHEFIHRHQQSKESRARAGRAVENDVRNTWAGMVSAGERAKQFSTQAAANTEVVKAYKDQFNLDRRTLLDVLDAQNELFVSRSNTINAEFVEMLAVYRLLALKGALLPTLGVSYPRESLMPTGDMWTADAKMKAR